MKVKIFRKFLFLATSIAFIACSPKANDKSDSGIESNKEDSATSQDSISMSTDSGELQYSKGDSLKDATRLSGEKDSVKGEATPPRIKEIY